MITLLKQYKLIGSTLAVLALTAVAAAGAWQWQENSYGKQLAELGRGLDAEIARRDQMHTDTLAEISRAAAGQLRDEQAKRLRLEGDLAELSKSKHKELIDAKIVADRLRDSLATADLRLSVLLDSTVGSTGNSCGVYAAAGAGGVVHGTARGELDPAHAQRIIGITNDGDEGLIALKACQAYARTISGME
jgi:hypothetical protein